MAVYGRPRSQKRLSYGGKPFELAAYAVHGRRLEIYYDRRHASSRGNRYIEPVTTGQETGSGLARRRLPRGRAALRGMRSAP